MPAWRNRRWTGWATIRRCSTRVSGTAPASCTQRAQRVATGLRRLGVSPGDRVVVFMANCPEVPIVYYAIWRAGAVATPVIFLISGPELRHILGDSGAVAVITSPELAGTVR